ncbi:hypothetical protein E2C01_034433 [Portunus trituberculatus]|uniref:Uncharacterized protein n=1 Tax=Portunus trituberculatus TaxID=210409 RepID=A0A5B7F0M0_PORTR|nr:hypothetical protein [Portunus trituberculatus]
MPAARKEALSSPCDESFPPATCSVAAWGALFGFVSESLGPAATAAHPTPARPLSRHPFRLCNTGSSSG